MILPRTDLVGAERAAERIADATEVRVLIGAAEATDEITSGAELLERAYGTLADRRARRAARTEPDRQTRRARADPSRRGLAHARPGASCGRAEPVAEQLSSSARMP